MNRIPLLFPLIVVMLFPGCDEEGPQKSDSSQDFARQKPVTMQGAQTPADSKPRRTAPTEDPALEKRRIQSDVRKLATAVYSGDVDTILSYTHPIIINALGGETQAKTTLKLALIKQLGLGLKLESMKFPSEPTFLKSDLHLFAIVPTKSIMSAKGKRVESLNFQFGIRKHASKVWKYIEGSRITKQNISQMFPDFPKDYEFPKTSRKLL